MNEAEGELVVTPRIAGPRPAPSVRHLMDTLPTRWCLLRDAETSGCGEIEYDMLVGALSAEVHVALERAGARRVRTWGRAPHHQYRWWDASQARPVRLDLVDELGFGAFRELIVDRREPVLDGVTTRDGWPRPSRSNEQWLAVLHGLLDRARLRPSDTARLEPWGATADDVVASALPVSLRVDIGAAAAARDWAALEQLREPLRDALTRQQRVASTIRRGWRASLRRSTKLQRAILRPGRRIAVLGPDGAGKSTTIEQLLRCGVVDSSVYLGVAPAELRRRSTLPGVALLRTIRRLSVAWLHASLRRRRGWDVALDRHPLEATIGPPTSKPTTVARRWVLAHLLPQPEAVVVLMAPASILYERKPEHAPREVLARQERYLELAERRGFPVIDTTQPPSAVLGEIRRVLFEASTDGRTR